MRLLLKQREEGTQTHTKRKVRERNEELLRKKRRRDEDQQRDERSSTEGGELHYLLWTSIFVTHTHTHTHTHTLAYSHTLTHTHLLPSCKLVAHGEDCYYHGNY